MRSTAVKGPKRLVSPSMTIMASLDAPPVVLAVFMRNWVMTFLPEGAQQPARASPPLSLLTMFRASTAPSQVKDVSCSLDRKSVVSGRSVSVREDIGGRGIITNKKKKSK